MKEEIKGKRFSKIKTTKAETKEDKIKLLESCASKPHTEWRTFDNVILGVTERATAILKKAGLPVTPLYKWIDNSEEAKNKNRKTDLKIDNILKERGLPFGDPIVERGTEWSGFISTYVVGYLKNNKGKTKYEHDSKEGLAARILTAIELMKIPEQKDNIPMLIFELGELTTLLNVYGIESSGNKGNAEGERPKLWKNTLIKYLCLNYPDNKLREYWDLIPDILDHKIYESPFSKMYIDWNEDKNQDCLYYRYENGKTQNITNKAIQNNITEYKKLLNK
jgi:hypothetical protein